MGSTLETPSEAVVPPPLVAAARLLRGLAWVCALVPAGLLVYTFPIGLVLILFGGSILVAPPVAFSIVGFRLSKSLRRGHRAVAALVFAGVQGCALFALSFHSTTWEPKTPGEGTFFWITTFATFLGGAASAGAALLIAAGVNDLRAPVDELEPGPRLWPWLVAAGGALLLMVLFSGVKGSNQ